MDLIKGRKYQDEFLSFGFSFQFGYEKGKNIMLPMCLYCQKILTNTSMNAITLNKHLEAHKKKSDFEELSLEELQVCDDDDDISKEFLSQLLLLWVFLRCLTYFLLHLYIFIHFYHF